MPPKKASIPSNWDVPELFRRRLGDVAGRQRAMSADGHLLLILHELPSVDTAVRHLRLFWRAPDGTWKSDCLGPGIAALQAHLAEYSKAVDHLDKLEAEAYGSDAYFQVRHAIAPLRRAAHNMHKTLQAGREAAPDDRELISCRNMADTIERAADLVQEDADHGLQYAMARQAEHQAVATQRLNILAALFLPLATVAAVFGMNVPHGLEHVFEPWLFWVVLVLGMMMGFVVRAFVAPAAPRRRKDKYSVGLRAK